MEKHSFYSCCCNELKCNESITSTLHLYSSSHKSVFLSRKNHEYLRIKSVFRIFGSCLVLLPRINFASRRCLQWNIVFNLHRTTIQHVLRTNTKLSSTTGKDSPQCVWVPWLCHLSSPLHPLLLVSGLSFLSLLFLLASISALLSS